MRTADFFTFGVDHEGKGEKAVATFDNGIQQIYGQDHRGNKTVVALTHDHDLAHDIQRALEPKMRDVYNTLAVLVAARLSCLGSNNEIWRDKHETRIKEILRDRFPHGAGFDAGCHLNFEKSTGERLVIITSFHHMNDVGMYDGWTEHDVIITPSLQFHVNLKITGRNKNNIKDHIAELFS